jgi:predicted transcriptional regulator
MDLAGKSGVDQRVISKLEKGRIGQRVSYLTVNSIMEALHRAGLKGVTAEDIFAVDRQGVS